MSGAVRVMQCDRDAAADAILADLRGRKLLKYLFNAEPEICGAYGYVEQPIDLETQREIALALTDIAFAKAITEETARAAQVATDYGAALWKSFTGGNLPTDDHAKLSGQLTAATEIATAIRASGGEGGRS